MLSSFHALPLPLVLLLISLVAAVPKNVTIDDADLAYFHLVRLHQLDLRAVGSHRPRRAPPTTGIQNQTWHDGMNLSSGSFVFAGSDVYIYGIDLANSANISFALDGTPWETHHYAGPDRFVFRALFFAAHDLAPGVNHTVEWAVHATKTNGSTVDLPATSSTSTPDSTPPSTPNKKSPSGGVIAGAVIAVIAGLGILAALAFFLLRRRRRRHAPAHIEPLVVAPIDTAASASPTSPGVAPEPSWASTTSPATRHHPDAKAYDVPWNNPAPHTTHTPYTSTESVVSPAQSHAPPLAPASQIPAPTSQPRAPSTPRADAASSDAVSTGGTAPTAALEARLADLEARVGAHLPPAYEGRGA
ncbi:hypothetical protein C8J57DRAFT_1658916 [Mycena rebaudengoi]|nr:hypothetical protein C8J57DRAFT_1658916 [Mycena rebaudengoi]